MLVALEGGGTHDGVGRFRDMRRDNQFAFQDWLTLRYGHVDLITRPCTIAFEVAAVLSRRGWPGLPTRCSLCRNTLDSDFAA